MPVHGRKDQLRRPSLALLAILAAIVPSGALAHGGGLNAEGCHNNRKTGGYHCHRGGSSNSSTVAQSSSRGLGLLNGSTGGSGAFRNCSAARAAGAAPVRRGDPGYGFHLDRDGDGVGCE
jgi:hypothetical protein